MRFRSLAVVAALTLATPLLGVPTDALAQAPARTVSISGELVDAGGRAMGNQTVELVRDNVVVRTGVTSSAGVWAFASLEPADYVVRAVINGQVVGTRVSALGGETAGVVIVAPAMATPSVQILIAGFAGNLAGTATAVATTAVAGATADVAQEIVVSGSTFSGGGIGILASQITAYVLIDTQGNVQITDLSGDPVSQEVRQQVIQQINQQLQNSGSTVIITGS